MNYDRYPFVRTSDGERISQYGVDAWGLTPDQYTPKPRPEYESDDPTPWARFPDGPGGPRSDANPDGWLYWRPRPEHERLDVAP